MANDNPWRSLQTLIPNTITVYMSQQEYEGVGGVGTGAPVDNTKPYKPWRDNSAWYPGSQWWGGVGQRIYNTFKTDNQGRLVLAPIESNEWFYTYQDQAIRTYREYRHLFPAGVPVLKMQTISGAEAGQFNYGSNGQFTPPPAEIGSNQMLAQKVPGGEWMVIDCQEWIKIQKAATPQTAEAKVARILEICQGSGVAEAKLSEIRLVAQISPQSGGVI